MGSEVKDGRRTRLRRTFAERVEAETFAKLKKIERENRGTAGISMPERLRGEAIEADRLLAPFAGVLFVGCGTRVCQARGDLVTKSEKCGQCTQGDSWLPKPV